MYSDTYYGDTTNADLAIPVEVTAGGHVTGLGVSVPVLTRFLSRIETIGGIRNAVFEFKTETGKTYIVEASETLLPGSWTVLSSIAGDGALAVHAEPIPTITDSLFYRVRLTLP